jgi:hypothetical protein
MCPVANLREQPVDHGHDLEAHPASAASGPRVEHLVEVERRHRAIVGVAPAQDRGDVFERHTLHVRGGDRAQAGQRRRRGINAEQGQVALQPGRHRVSKPSVDGLNAGAGATLQRATPALDDLRRL